MSLNGSAYHESISIGTTRSLTVDHGPQPTSADAVKHFGDWPNSLGFDTSYEEREPVKLQVEGHIPAYAAGILYRTGVGPRTVDCGPKGTFRANHWFDNFAQVHRFQIDAPKGPDGKVSVTYNSRLTSDGLIEKVRKVGRMDGVTFAAKYEPCKTLFQKLQAVFLPATRILPKPALKPHEANINVTLSVNMPGLSASGQPVSEPANADYIASLCTKTDASVVQMLDSKTLEPISLARQEKSHPDLKGPMSAAHPKSDPLTGDVFNFNLQFGGPQGTYRLFRISASTGQTTILATIQHTATYLHSFFLTENYVVFCIWNSQFSKGGMSILWNQNIAESMFYNDQVPAKWYVVDKKPPEEGGRGVVATYESPGFFGFHAVNAYETQSADGTRDIIADIPAYRSLDVLKAFYFENILSDSPTAVSAYGKWGDSIAPNYRRYRLPFIPDDVRQETHKAVLEFELDRLDTVELPVTNPKYDTKKHRYVYGVFDSGKSTFADSIIKLDLETKTSRKWTVHGQTAGEPIFIADPASEDEDGGVLLSVVLDGISGKSYLLVVDAKDLSELGRASVNGAIGFGFHGLHTKLPADEQVAPAPAA